MTIVSTPATYSSAQDDLIFTVTDPKALDPVTYPNYKFIGDVYIGLTLVARVKKIPDPSSGVGVFNIGQIVRNYIITNFNPAPNQIVAQELGDGVFSALVQMHFGEEYTGTTTLDIIVDSQRRFFNNYNGRYFGSTTSLSEVLDKTATGRPQIGTTMLTQVLNLIPYFPTSITPVSFIVTPFGGGSVYSTNFTPSNENDMQILNVSPVALNAVHAGTITADTTSYNVQIGSQTYVFNLICESQYTVYAIHFLNHLGGFETKLFTKVSRFSVDVTKKDFGKLKYLVDGSGNVTYTSTNGIANETRSVYSSQFKEKIQLNSDFLTDQEFRWLEDLILSPMVFIEDRGFIFPVSISDTNYEFKKTVNDDLSNLTINVEFGQTLNAQFR